MKTHSLLSCITNKIKFLKIMLNLRKLSNFRLFFFFCSQNFGFLCWIKSILNENTFSFSAASRTNIPVNSQNWNNLQYPMVAKFCELFCSSPTKWNHAFFKHHAKIFLVTKLCEKLLLSPTKTKESRIFKNITLRLHFFSDWQNCEICQSSLDENVRNCAS